MGLTNFKYQVFISYRNKKPFFARCLYFALKELGYSVFFDKEKLDSGYFTEQIMPAIKNSSYFIPVLTNETFDGRDESSDYMLKELDCAKTNLPLNHIIPIYEKDFNFKQPIPQKAKFLLDLQSGSISNENFLSDIKSFCDKYLIDIDLVAERTYIRTANDSYKKRTPESTIKELNRLAVQFAAFENIDKPIYEEIISKYPNGFTSLDVGCGSGGRGMFYLGLNPKCIKHVGIDYNHEFIDKAKQEYGSKASFYEVNIESDDFDFKMEEILKEKGLKGFDIVNICLVLLHIENPNHLLQKIKKYLNPNGSIFILDLDDGYNKAFPDEDNWFRKANEICFKLPITGHRHTGRQIYTYLKSSGYKNIQLKYCLLNTNNWDKDKKASLFDGRIGLVKRVLTRTVNNYSTMPEKHKQYLEFKKDLVQLEKVFPDMERKFLEDSFYYTCTHMIYVAENDGKQQTEKKPIKF